MPKDFVWSFHTLVGWYFRFLGEVLSNWISEVSFRNLSFFFFSFGGHLLSHTVSSAVPSAAQVLTIVFGMGTGVSPERIATKKVEFLMNPHN